MVIDPAQDCSELYLFIVLFAVKSAFQSLDGESRRVNPQIWRRRKSRCRLYRRGVPGKSLPGKSLWRRTLCRKLDYGTLCHVLTRRKRAAFHAIQVHTPFEEERRYVIGVSMGT